MCLLLAISFLYNPYVIAHCSAGTLDVRHPLSHRATVGASELEKYSPVAGIDVDLPVSLWLVGALALPGIMLCRFTPDQYDLALPQASPRGSTWFRPPPAP